LAILYVHAGHAEQALEWLDRAFEARDPFMPYIGVVPGLDDLHDEPHYQNLLRRMNFPEDVIAKYLNEGQ
jgi:hypothetical protein